MLQAYEGYLEKNHFYPIGSPINMRGRHRVIVTLLDEQNPADEKVLRVAALDKFFAEINASDEEVPETFERVNFNRGLEL